MGTLGHERVGTAGLAISDGADLDAMITWPAPVNPDALDDPELRERIARAHTDIEYTRLLNYRALSKILKGEKNWPEVPLAKLQWSHLAQTLAELAVDLLGPAGAPRQGRARRGRRRHVEPALRLPALHVDRRRHHRGAEEHHRRQGPEDGPPLNPCCPRSVLDDGERPLGAVGGAERALASSSDGIGSSGPNRIRQWPSSSASYTSGASA